MVATAWGVGDHYYILSLGDFQACPGPALLDKIGMRKCPTLFWSQLEALGLMTSWFSQGKIRPAERNKAPGETLVFALAKNVLIFLLQTEK